MEKAQLFFRVLLLCRKDRITIQEKEKDLQKQKEQEQKAKQLAHERRQQTLKVKSKFNLSHLSTTISTRSFRKLPPTISWYSDPARP